MFEVTPIPAFDDNYIWMLHRNGHAVLVDPGDADPVEKVLADNNLQLDAILVTHHHSDHTGGVAGLLKNRPAAVYAPAKGHYAFPHHPVSENDVIVLSGIDARVTVMETPGHTLDHVVYFDDSHLFCGDTLFSCGCGRLFEGSCGQLYRSLQRLARLPEETAVYCTHEYTRRNIEFALMVDPGNPALHQRSLQVEQLLQSGKPTLPSTMAIELATNPFLRCHSSEVVLYAAENGMPSDASAEGVFCALRKLRNSF